jgi:hypothetical protein
MRAFFTIRDQDLTTDFLLLFAITETFVPDVARISGLSILDFLFG